MSLASNPIERMQGRASSLLGSADRSEESPSVHPRGSVVPGVSGTAGLGGEHAGLRSRRGPRWALAIVLFALALFVAAGTRPAQAAGAAVDPSTELAHRYAPALRLKEVPGSCGIGEPYVPIDVNLLMGNPEVALRGPWDTSNVVKVGPTAADLGRGLFGYNLDFPGNALQPGCTYEAWQHHLIAHSSPLMYARVVTQAGVSGEARAAVLVLLRLQRLAEYARGRLGDDPAQLRCGDAGRGAGDAPGRGWIQPALERGARRLGCRTAANRRGHPPGRLRRQRLAGELLRVGPVSDAKLGRRRRVRRHDRALGDDQPGGRRHPDRRRRLPQGLSVAGLPRTLGRTAGGVFQRPHWPQPEGAVDRAVHLGRDDLARRDVRGAGGRGDADVGDGLLLRGCRPGVDGTP